MIAFARLASVPCQRLAPNADSFHALALRRLIKPPITEEEIAAKEKDIKRLRVRLGLSGWCKLAPMLALLRPWSGKLLAERVIEAQRVLAAMESSSFCMFLVASAPAASVAAEISS